MRLPYEDASFEMCSSLAPNNERILLSRSFSIPTFNLSSVSTPQATLVCALLVCVFRRFLGPNPNPNPNLGPRLA